MSADFFDNDLLRSINQERGEDSDGVTIRPISEVNLNRLAKQKQEVSQQVAGAIEEIEKLRMKQEQLEKEKGNLEELATKQELYERGKRDIVDKLSRSIVLLDKEASQVKRLSELLIYMRGQFENSLTELRDIDEDRWSEGEFDIEMTKALALVDSARSLYDEGLAKIEAAGWRKDGTGNKPSPILSAPGDYRGTEKSFAYWMKVGLAVSLPLIVSLLVILGIYLLISGMIR